uniref:Tetratricopeptide repeat protein n=1 Tax=Marseillevirus LCMAC102 TaxID=2506603 RepID=A0A481YUL6_9VIRU|nr:MAG: tetratricopeptide repeat protein [Marseillevirus LCMAC102]
MSRLVQRVFAHGYMFYSPPEAQESLKLLQRAIQICPSDSNTYINMAACLTRLGRHEEATKSLQQANKSNPFL